MNDEDLAKTIALLKQLQPGFLPYDIFIQIARLSVLSIIELVPLRYKDNKVEVLLTQRALDDPFWPGRWHSPGTVVRPTDSSLTKEAFQRIVDDELKGTELSEPQFVESLFRKTLRGKENVQVFRATVLEEPKVGSFYPVDNLPTTLVESQASFIQRAASSLKA